MKLLYSYTGKEEGLAIVDDALVFMCVKPVTVQPSEVVRVPIGLKLKVEQGFTLNISTHPTLVEKLGEVFPGAIVVNSADGGRQLDIPVRNAGRNPIHIMVGDLVARGYIAKNEPVDGEEIDFASVTKEVTRSKPQKKNPDFKFEMKN